MLDGNTKKGKDYESIDISDDSGNWILMSKRSPIDLITNIDIGIKYPLKFQIHLAMMKVCHFPRSREFEYAIK